MNAYIGLRDGLFSIYIMVYDSKYEAKNFKYWIKLNKNDEEFMYKGPVKSVDDDKTTIWESKCCLNIPLKVVEECLKGISLKILCSP